MKKTEPCRKGLMERYRKTIGEQEKTGRWETFEGFYQWAMENGYSPGDRLLKKKRDRPYGPDNCGFKHVKKDAATELGTAEMNKRIRAWNRAVNPLRVAAGLESFADPVMDEKETLPE